jgi:hypothetical protein
VFRRLLRVTVKLGIIAAVGFGIAVVVKKLTAPAESPYSPEPWPPLQAERAEEAADTVASTVGESSNGEGLGG